MNWEDKIFDITPVEMAGVMWFKREDKFAPLGYGDINGAKLRQCIYLINKWVKERGISGVVSGAVANSPQHAFVSMVCRYYRIGCLIVTAKKETAESKYLQIAKNNGSSFFHSKIGYAKTLGSHAEKLAKQIPGHTVLETNITLDEKKNNAESIEAFHKIGSEQSKNIPDHIETIIIPCGSCNSVTSVLYGICRYPPKQLNKIVLLGIGNLGSKDIHFVERRLQMICKVSGANSDIFDWSFNGEAQDKIQLFHYDLNGSGFCKYEDEMNERYGEIKFHPRYEAKCFRYVRTKLPDLINQKSLFWIIGSDITRKSHDRTVL